MPIDKGLHIRLVRRILRPEKIAALLEDPDRHVGWRTQRNGESANKPNVTLAQCGPDQFRLLMRGWFRSELCGGFTRQWVCKLSGDSYRQRVALGAVGVVAHGLHVSTRNVDAVAGDAVETTRDSFQSGATQFLETGNIQVHVRLMVEPDPRRADWPFMRAAKLRVHRKVSNVLIAAIR